MNYRFKVGEKVRIRNIGELLEANLDHNPIMSKDDDRLKYCNEIFTISAQIPPEKVDADEKEIPNYALKEESQYWWYESELQSLIKEKIKMLQICSTTVVQWSPKPKAVGSNPTRSAIYNNAVVKIQKKKREGKDEKRNRIHLETKGISSN